MQEAIKNNSAETRKNKYYYPSALTHRSLRKTLRSGTTKKEERYIKDFECLCVKHKGILISTLAKEDCDRLNMGKCELSVTSKKVMAIDDDGNILIAGYQFYSMHPEWKVRAATAFGLVNIQHKDAMNILAKLLLDKHYGVKHAAVQALETIKSRQAITYLENIIAKNKDKRLLRTVQRAIERIQNGVNAGKTIVHTVKKFQARQLVRKIFQPGIKRSKLLVPKSLFHGSINKKRFRNFINHMDISLKYQRSYRIFLQFNEQKISLSGNRVSSKNTAKNKKNFITYLFFQRCVLVDSIQDIERPLKGEIYWALTDSTDPKATRPVLIIGTVKGKENYFLIAPFTTQDLSLLTTNVSVYLKNKKSNIQLSRQREIHRSELLNKYGELSKEELHVVLSKWQHLKNVATPNNERRVPKPKKLNNHSKFRTKIYINLSMNNSNKVLNKNNDHPITPVNNSASIRSRGCPFTLFEYIKSPDQTKPSNKTSIYSKH